MVDTNIVLFHLDGISNATQLLLDLGDQGVSISTISYTEVIGGLQGPKGTAAAVRSFRMLVGQSRIVPFGLEEAVVAGRIRYELRQQGRRVRPRGLDLLIAATALAHDLTFVTTNPSDFHDVPGLRIEVPEIHV